MDIWMFERLNDMLLGDITPQLTFYLDLDPKVALERASSRNVADDVYDSKNLSFYHKIRESFVDIALSNGSRIFSVNANTSRKKIHELIKTEAFKNLDFLI